MTHRRPLIALIAFVVLLGADAAAAAAQAPRSTVPQQARRLGKPSTPPDAKGRNVLAAANQTSRKKILVSTEDRWLWLVEGRDTLMSVPVSVGMSKSFEFDGKKFFFETPRSQRRVLAKEENPRWNVPEWHYLERAKANGYGVVRLAMDTKHELEDGTFILVIGKNVGRLNQFGNFFAFPPGMEIMFDGKVFIPPVGTEQRLVPDALGPFKLDTGDGYLIHGTNLYTEDAIGEAVSHGCVRMRNSDLEKLYAIVPVGTPVYVF